MKSEERHQLEQNELADWLVRILQNVRPYVPYVAAAVGIAILGFLASSYLSASRQQKYQDAWAEYFQAQNADQLDTVVSRYPNTPVVPYAKLRAADLLFQEAKNKLLSDRSDALVKLDKATALYQALADASDAPREVRLQAAYAAAVAIETKGALKDAQQAFQKVIDQYPGTLEAVKAKERIEQLGKPEAQQFYARLIDFKVPEPSLDLPGRTQPDLPPVDVPLPPAMPEKADTSKNAEPILPAELKRVDESKKGEAKAAP